MFCRAFHGWKFASDWLYTGKNIIAKQNTILACKFPTECSLSIIFTLNIKADKKHPNSDMQKYHQLNNLMQQSTCNKAPSCRVNSDILLNRNCRVIRLYFIDQTLILNTSGNSILFVQFTIQHQL